MHKKAPAGAFFCFRTAMEVVYLSKNTALDNDESCKSLI